MTDRRPDEPAPADFRQTAARGWQADIADENAAHVDGAVGEGEKGDATLSDWRSSEQVGAGDKSEAPRLPGSVG